jgi:hypothetical protein
MEFIRILSFKTMGYRSNQARQTACRMIVSAALP